MAEWFPLEAPSGRIKDRMKVQVRTVFGDSYEKGKPTIQLYRKMHHIFTLWYIVRM